MTFLKISKADQLSAHPVLKIIPYIIWESEFCCEIATYNLALFALPYAEALEHFYNIIPYRDDRSFVCMLLAHPDISISRKIHDLMPYRSISHRSLIALLAAGKTEDLKEYFQSLSKESQEQVLTGELCSAFQMAAKTGNMETLIYIISLAPHNTHTMIQDSNWKAFRLAAEYGHLNVLLALDGYTDNVEKLKMMKADDYGAFRQAAQNGHKKVLEYLLSFSSTEFNLAMIKGTNNKNIRDFVAFRLAASNGHLEILDYLRNFMTSEENKSIKNYFFDANINAFHSAAGKGHQKILEYLLSLAPGESGQRMIESENHLAFISAAAGGHIQTMEYLLSVAPDRAKMIKSLNYNAFSCAAKNGHIEALKYLLRLEPEIELQGFFYWAAQNDQKEILKYLISLKTGHQRQMITAQNYGAFSNTILYGARQSAEYLISLADHPADIRAMIRAVATKQTVRSAAKNGHKDTIEYLFSIANFEEQALLRADLPGAIQEAVNQRRGEVICYLLNFSTCMSFAEAHIVEMGDWVNPFISRYMAVLKSESSAFYEAHPNGIFDIENEERKLLIFYMLRNLIRRNNASLLEDIRFLLDIPGIKNLIHLSVNQGESNELLRLAFILDNQPAAQLLLSIPAVRQLAEENSFYIHEMQGNIDLAALARDAESSIKSLTPGESRRLERLERRYQGIIKERQTQNIFKALKETLSELYLKTPITLKIKDKHIDLPLSWSEFDKLQLPPDDFNKAMKAYYQHTIHSAYRYLSRPNPWMSVNAAYVQVNGARTERWSTFEEHLPLICLLFTAATDKDEHTLTDGYTRERRIMAFIHELAMIGRAHNWDKYRPARDLKTRKLLLDKDGKPVTEQFDDLEGDKPSCYSGVKRRLLQSLLGHSDMRIFGENILRQELREFLREHFKQRIHHKNLIGIENAINDILMNMDDPTPEQQALLAELDVSWSTAEDFMHAMQTKYYEELIHDFELRSWLKLQFKLGGNFTCHFFKFYDLVDAGTLLQNKKEELLNSNRPEECFVSESVLHSSEHIFEENTIVNNVMNVLQIREQNSMKLTLEYAISFLNGCNELLMRQDADTIPENLLKKMEERISEISYQKLPFYGFFEKKWTKIPTMGDELKHKIDELMKRKRPENNNNIIDDSDDPLLYRQKR